MASMAILIDNMFDIATLTASTEVTGMEVEQLQQSNVTDDLWRSTASTASVTVDQVADLSIDTIALFGLNLTSGATIRVRVSTGGAGETGGDLHDETYTIADPEFDSDYRSLIVMLPSPVSGRFVRFDMNDGSLSYLEAGRVVGGLRETLDYNFAPTSSLGWEDLSSVVKAKGGQSLVWERAQRRVVTVDIPWVTNTQRWGLIEELGRDNGRHKDVLVMLDANADNLSQWSVWGLVLDPSPVAWTSIPELYSMNLKVEERL